MLGFDIVARAVHLARGASAGHHERAGEAVSKAMFILSCCGGRCCAAGVASAGHHERAGWSSGEPTAVQICTIVMVVGSVQLGWWLQVLAIMSGLVKQ